MAAPFDRITPEEAQSLLSEGYAYVDVRSEPEFTEGHVPGAFNVPFMHLIGGKLQPNPEFMSVMEASFAKDARLVIGCKSGSRSMKAAHALSASGFGTLKELRTGWDGSRDAFGRVEPGWSKKGLPVELGAPSGQSYADVKQRTR